MEGTPKQVRKRIESWERGRIFFLQDFVDMDSQGAVRIALSEFAHEGFIARLARGIYCYPRLEGDRNPHMVLPSPETIAEAVACSELVRIIPYGDQASRRLGLWSSVLSEYMYLTDGAPRRISLSNGRKIIFNHTSEVKIFGFRNEMMQLVSSAIRVMGAENIGEREERIIREHLRTVSQKDFMADIRIPPAWVQDIMIGLWNR